MARSSRPDVFERWTPVWHAFFYVMIVIATVLVLHRQTVSSDRVRVVALACALLVWHVVMMVRTGRGHRERPRQVALYLAVAGAISTLLVSIDLTFLMVAMTLYNQIFAFMVTRWALPAAAMLTAVLGVVATRGADGPAAVVVFLGAGAAMLFAVYLGASADESRKRGALIEELERTREQLTFAERLAGRTEERHRIARDLHDTVAQQLVGIVMHLEAARDAPDAQTILARALVLAREGLTEARRLVWAERPIQLESASLTGALVGTLDRFHGESGVAVEHVVGDGLDGVPATVQTLVLRAVQEALANVKKHARAERVVVTITVSDDLVTLDVQDDGVGFDPAATTPANGAGFGLQGLRERVTALRGTLVVESARGAGTTVAVHVPLAHEERA